MGASSAAIDGQTKPSLRTPSDPAANRNRYKEYSKGGGGGGHEGGRGRGGCEGGTGCGDMKEEVEEDTKEEEVVKI